MTTTASRYRDTLIATYGEDLGERMYATYLATQGEWADRWNNDQALAKEARDEKF